MTDANQPMIQESGQHALVDQPNVADAEKSLLSESDQAQMQRIIDSLMGDITEHKNEIVERVAKLEAMIKTHNNLVQAMQYLDPSFEVTLLLSTVRLEETPFKDTSDSSKPPARRNPSASVTNRETIKLLEQHDHPMNYKDIHRALENKGFGIHGKSASSNFLMRLNREENIVRFSRGSYGLKAWTDYGAPDGKSDPDQCPHCEQEQVGLNNPRQ